MPSVALLFSWILLTPIISRLSTCIPLSSNILVLGRSIILLLVSTDEEIIAVAILLVAVIFFMLVSSVVPENINILSWQS